MTTRAGRNMKWIVAPAHRSGMRALFTEVLGARSTRPNAALDLYTLSDGTNVGVFIEDDALTAEQGRKGAWLEFLVDDVAVAVSAARKVGLEPIEYVDKAHTYFQAPGGPVFRFASS